MIIPSLKLMMRYLLLLILFASFAFAFEGTFENATELTGGIKLGTEGLDSGDGSDGSLNVSGKLYVDEVRAGLVSSAPSGSVVLELSDPTGFSPGDEVLVIGMQGTGAGVYETKSIESISGTELTLLSPLDNSYDAAQKVMVQRVPHYAVLLIKDGGELTMHPWDGSTGGVLFLRAKSLVIEQAGLINVSAKGYRGGSSVDNGHGYQGESYMGEGSYAVTSANYGAGGGSTYHDWGGGGGGGASYATSGTSAGGGFGASGSAGSVYGEQSVPLLIPGSGGGGGADCSGYDAGSYGGSGGGVLVIFAGSIENNGVISADGADAVLHAGSNAGGGGGGSGGLIYLTSLSISSSGEITSLGGAGGFGPGNNAEGGNGGNGRVRFDYTLIQADSDPSPGYAGELSFYSTGMFTSAPAQTETQISSIFAGWNSTVPAGTSLSVEVSANGQDWHEVQNKFPKWTDLFEDSSGLESHSTRISNGAAFLAPLGLSDDFTSDLWAGTVLSEIYVDTTNQYLYYSTRRCASQTNRRLWRDISWAQGDFELEFDFKITYRYRSGIVYVGMWSDNGQSDYVQDAIYAGFYSESKPYLITRTGGTASSTILSQNTADNTVYHVKIRRAGDLAVMELWNADQSLLLSSASMESTTAELPYIMVAEAQSGDCSGHYLRGTIDDLVFNAGYSNESEQISVGLTKQDSWSRFYVQDDLPQGTSVLYQILDPQDSVLMDVIDGTDISSVQEDTIKLRAELTTSNSSVTPMISGWAVSSERSNVSADTSSEVNNNDLSYRVLLSTSNASITPVLSGILVDYVAVSTQEGIRQIARNSTIPEAGGFFALTLSNSTLPESNTLKMLVGSQVLTKSIQISEDVQSITINALVSPNPRKSVEFVLEG